VTQPPYLAADHITHLIRGWTTTETIRRPTQDTNGRWKTTNTLHTVQHPPLLNQLEEAVTGTTLTNDDTYRHNTGSKPAARLDAIVVLQRIDRQSRELATRLHLDRAPLRPRLSGIAGKLATTTDPTVAAWWRSARIVTGWDSPPYSPPVPCPNETCEKRGTLRIRLADRIATCVECGSTWGPDEINMLGRWVEWAADHLTGPTHWTTTPDGYPTECVECIGTRREMGERAARRAAEHAAAG
jgi:hypothetical protein